MLSSTLDLLGTHPDERDRVAAAVADLPQPPSNRDLVEVRTDLRWPLVEALRPAISHADGAGVRLALENEPGTPPEQFNDLFDRLSERGHAPHRVGMCFDMGHANLHPDTRNDYVGYFDRLAPCVPVIHLHVHENHGDGDTHLPVGRGPAGGDGAGLRALADRLERAGYEGAMIMEQWPDPPTLLCEARDCLRHHFAPRPEPASI
jgi:sugar phosphate isomerase/epimerase